MKVFDELKRMMKFDDDDDYMDDEEEIVPARNAVRAREDIDIDMNANAKNNKVVNIHATTQLQVVLVKPERFDQAAEIADHLRDKRTVVVNLESANKEVARRLLDFLSGAAYSKDGKIQKIANSTYLITPFNVEIMGDLIDELENNGLYF